MPDQSSSVPFTSGLPETTLPPVPADVAAALAAAEALGPDVQVAAVSRVAAANPKYLEAWARLSELALAAGDPVAAYAYARVGYHRGLDAARGAGWRGSGYIRWRSAENRGFLASLDGLRRAAEAIGEAEEAERCRLFLHQLDPDWDRRPG